MKVKTTKRPLPCYTTNGLRISSLKVYIVLNYLPSSQYIESGQADKWQMLHCQFFWHKNKICHQTNNSSRYLKKCSKCCEQFCHIFWQKNIMWRNLKLGNLISQNNSDSLKNNKNRKIKGINIRPIPRHIDNDTINVCTYKLKILMSQATPRQKLHCQKIWHKNKMWLQVNDISSHHYNYHGIIISLKNIMWSVETGQVAQQQKLHCQIFWHNIKICRQVNDSPGLFRGRLEGEPLTVRAVCDGTVRWKDPGRPNMGVAIGTLY